MFEEWREVPGYGGKYLVGSDGSVVSLKGKRELGVSGIV
jgi:hypothetical protein